MKTLQEMKTIIEGITQERWNVVKNEIVRHKNKKHILMSFYRHIGLKESHYCFCISSKNKRFLRFYFEGIYSRFSDCLKSFRNSVNEIKNNDVRKELNNIEKSVPNIIFSRFSKKTISSEKYSSRKQKINHYNKKEQNSDTVFFR